MAAPTEPPFPRGKGHPGQSPRFWVHQKDRYLRQLLIRDIEERTERDLIVYFTDCDTVAQIDQNDDTYLIELLGDRKLKGVDLLIETNGGKTDATEKVVSVLRHLAGQFRAVVPRRAKSNGTLLALAAAEIVMGPNSELGPIDPFLLLNPTTPVPADFIINAPGPKDPILAQAANAAMNQTRTLATRVLKEGMLSKAKPEDVDELVKKISSRSSYHSHGSVIDFSEAKALGLNVDYRDESDELWQSFWLLRTMYEYDCKHHGLSKVFEAARISSSISLPPPPQK